MTKTWKGWSSFTIWQVQGMNECKSDGSEKLTMNCFVGAQHVWHRQNTVPPHCESGDTTPLTYKITLELHERLYCLKSMEVKSWAWQLALEKSGRTVRTELMTKNLWAGSMKICKNAVASDNAISMESSLRVPGMCVYSARLGSCKIGCKTVCKRAVVSRKTNF